MPWEPGQSGNPGGKPKGELNRVTAVEYAMMERARQLYGEGITGKERYQVIAEYLAGLPDADEVLPQLYAKILPRETNVTNRVELSFEEAMRQIAAQQRPQLPAQPQLVSVEVHDAQGQPETIEVLPDPPPGYGRNASGNLFRLPRMPDPQPPVRIADITGKRWSNQSGEAAKVAPGASYEAESDVPVELPPIPGISEGSTPPEIEPVNPS